MLSASSDATLEIWDSRQGHILYTLYGHERTASAVQFSSTEEFFVGGEVDSRIMVWKSNIERSEENVIEMPKKPAKTTKSEKNLERVDRNDRVEDGAKIEKRLKSQESFDRQPASRSYPAIKNLFCRNIRKS